MLTDKQKVLIEKLGVIMERPGMAPAVARVNALLIVSDELELTFDDIRELLHFSKSATSNAINFLVNIGEIEYITKPGDRRRYFRSNCRNFTANVQGKFKEISNVNEVFREILENRTSKTPEFNENMRYMVELSSFILSKLPAIVEEFEAKLKN